jgi:hypothetical protein
MRQTVMRYEEKTFLWPNTFTDLKITGTPDFDPYPEF